MGCFISLFRPTKRNEKIDEFYNEEKNIEKPERQDTTSTEQSIIKDKKTEKKTKDSTMLIAYAISFDRLVGLERNSKFYTQGCRPHGFRFESGQFMFIHDVTGSYQHGVAPEASMQPHTRRIQTVSTQIKGPYCRQCVTLIDTPGFDYSRNNDEHTTFKQLARWLRKTYGSRAKLDGVVYMHNIWNEELYRRPTLYTSDPLEQLCGPDWRRKIIFVNSHWDEGIGDDGAERESRLMGGYWNYMLQRGSAMMRYESPGDRGRAQEILEYFIDRNLVYLR